ncbi:MAG: KilA-N domain-containing protein [Polaribacter sp.]
MAKYNKLIVEGIEITLTQVGENDFISLTDMVRAKDGDFFVSDWLRNRNTLEYLGAWETLNNPNFNYGEFAIIKDKSGLNNFKVSVKEWVERTNSIGITAKTGRYGGTYAHKDIAFNFGMWISPVFQLYIVKEYQRLKEIESNKYNLEWNVRRILTKTNYKIHTDAIKNYVIPRLSYSQKKDWIYAKEADLLNIVLFGCTAKQWKEVNPERVLKGENIRDMASINELAILSNLENLNAVLNKQGIDKQKRLKILSNLVTEQRVVLGKIDIMKSVKKQNDMTYLDEKSNKNKEK